MRNHYMDVTFKASDDDTEVLERMAINQSALIKSGNWNGHPYPGVTVKLSNVTLSNVMFIKSAHFEDTCHFWRTTRIEYMAYD